VCQILGEHDTEGKLRLFYLPPYVPQLNPDETVWAYMKRYISKIIIYNQEELKKFALSSLHHIQKLPELIKSLFRQSECRYADI